MSLWLPWSSKHPSTREPRGRLPFTGCLPQSPCREKNVYLYLILKIGLTHVYVAGWFLCRHFPLGLGAWSLMGIFSRGDEVLVENRSLCTWAFLQCTRPKAPRAKRSISVMDSVSCAALFAEAKAFVSVSETVRDQSSKYSLENEKCTFLKPIRT